MIGDIEVFVVDIRSDKVRIGITAPKDVPVHRREVYDIINNQKNGVRNEQSEDESNE